jgi:nucleotide-binding universal stress UspA family protein
MLKHILVLLDESFYAEYALAHAVAIANTLNAQVTLLRLMEQTPVTTSKHLIDPLDWQVYKMETEAELNRLSSRLKDMGLQVQQAVQEAKSAELIIDFAQEHEVDLIVVALPDHDTGDITSQFMRHTNIPVLIARADSVVKRDPSIETYHKILVPLDGSPRAEVVLSLASTLASASGAELILAHVVHKPEISRRAPLSPEDANLANQLVDRNREEGLNYMENLVSRLNGSVHYRLLVDDNVANALHDLVEQEAADLVILSAHGYSGLPRWPYGSIAGSFIAFGDKPVLVVQDLPNRSVQPRQVDAPLRQARDR